MKRSSQIICASLCAILLLGFTSTAAAQDRPSMEISGGWRFLHSTENIRLVDNIGVRFGAS